MANSNLYTVLSGITECISGLNVKIDEISSSSGSSGSGGADSADISAISAVISSYVQDRDGVTVDAPSNQNLMSLLTDVESTLSSINYMINTADL